MVPVLSKACIDNIVPVTCVNFQDLVIRRTWFPEALHEKGRRVGGRGERGRMREEGEGKRNKRKLVTLKKVQGVMMADFEANLTGLMTKCLLG